MDILIDYLTFSLSERYSISRIMTIFGLNKFTYVEGNSKFRGYKYSMYAKGVIISYGGVNSGCCISLSGTGCRALESFNEDFEWYKMLMLLYKHKCNVSRLDVACDEKENILNMKTLFKSSLNHFYVTNFSQPLVLQGREEEVLWGAKTSRIRIRIYNKALERKIDTHWIRCEIQLRDEACDSFFREWFINKNLGLTYYGILINQIRYTQSQNTGNHLNRLKTSLWWTKFTQGAERIKLTYRYGLEYNLEKNERYIFGQAGISVAMWLKANGGDINKLAEHMSNQSFRFTNEHKSKIDILEIEVKKRLEISNNIKNV